MAQDQTEETEGDSGKILSLHLGLRSGQSLKGGHRGPAAPDLFST